MRAVRLTSSGGFTLIAAMVMVVVMGVMMGVASQSWRMIMQREREVELLFRGTQIRDAIARYYRTTPGQTGQTGQPGQPGRPGQPATPAQSTRRLMKLEDLLQDPNSLETVKYLRKLYKDPITSKDFVPILDATQRIVGVRSSSDKQPIKKGNFPEDLKDFEGKLKYSDWQFNSMSQAYIAALAAGVQGTTGVQTPGSPGVTGLPGATGIPGGLGVPGGPGGTVTP